MAQEAITEVLGLEVDSESSLRELALEKREVRQFHKRAEEATTILRGEF